MRPGNGRPPGLQVKTGMYWESSPESPAQAHGEAEGPRKGPESRREQGSCSQRRGGEEARGKGRQPAVPPLSRPPWPPKSQPTKLLVREEATRCAFLGREATWWGGGKRMILFSFHL